MMDWIVALLLMMCLFVTGYMLGWKKCLEESEHEQRWPWVAIKPKTRKEYGHENQKNHQTAP